MLDFGYKPLLDTQASASNRRVILSAVIGAAALVAFLLLTVAAASVTSSQVTQPIEILTAAVQGVESGDVDIEGVEALAKRGDEIGYKARSFLQMLAETQGRQDMLRREVGEIREKHEALHPHPV